MKNNLHKTGFTLIELSIVLVIIGLLIGGILVARSMIESAKVGSLIRQVEQFDIASTNFQTQYNSIPGDSPYFDTAGNNDGVITEDPTASPSDEFKGEISNFWKHLVDSEMLQSDIHYSNVGTSGVIPNIQIPSYDNSKEAGFVVWGADYGIGSPFVGKTNFYTLGKFSLVDNNLGTSSCAYSPSPNGAITPARALAVDIKIDDGAPLMGNINDMFYSSPECSTQLGCANDEGIYDVSNTNTSCYLSFKMFSKTTKQ